MKCRFVALRVIMATLFFVFSCLPGFTGTSNAAAPDAEPTSTDGAAAVEGLVEGDVTANAVGQWTVGKKKGSHFKSLLEAMQSPDVLDGDVLNLTTGTFEGSEITKNVTIVGTLKKNGQIGTTIKGRKGGLSGVNAGFLFPGQGKGSNSKIMNVKFQNGLDFPVFSKGADNVTISGSLMTKPLQGITNINGSGWSITGNTIKNLEALGGGGMGIFVGATNTGTADNNTVSQNTIEGKMYVKKKDVGGYMGCAIGIASNVVLPVGATGEIEQVDEILATSSDNATVTGNKIDNNTISIVSAKPGVVEMYDIGLYELGTDGTLIGAITETTILDNVITGAIAEGPAGLTTSNGNKVQEVAVPTTEGMKLLP